MFDATVVANSRDWVCVRLATYENELEGAFLETIYLGRNGTLENTTFALLAPDGKTPLARTGRGPHFLLGERGPPPGRGERGGRRGRGPPPERSGRPGEGPPPERSGRPGEGPRPEQGPPPPGGAEGAQAFAALLASHAKSYRPKATVAALPQSLDFRRALNVAACDNQPLVVAYGASETARAALEKQLAELAWQAPYVGRLQYMLVSDRNDLAVLEGLPEGEAVLFVQPDRFGLQGAVLGHVASPSTPKALRELFDKGLAGFEVFKKETRSHKRAARKAGVKEWKTEIPVTDPGIPPPHERGGR